MSWFFLSHIRLKACISPSSLLKCKNSSVAAHPWRSAVQFQVCCQNSSLSETRLCQVLVVWWRQSCHSRITAQCHRALQRLSLSNNVEVICETRCAEALRQAGACCEDVTGISCNLGFQLFCICDSCLRGSFWLRRAGHCIKEESSVEMGI